MNLKNLKGWLCLGAAGLLATGSAQAVLITFDDLGLNPLDDVTTQYAPQGVTFHGVDDGGGGVNLEVADNGVFPDNNPVSLPFSLSNFYNHSGGNRAHIMQILFSSAAHGISFYYNGAGGSGSSTVFNVYNTAHTLVDTFSVAAAIDADFHLVNVADANVGELDIVNPGSGWGHYIDNLSFTESATGVPDGGFTAYLLAAGLGVLGLIRRKLA